MDLLGWLVFRKISEGRLAHSSQRKFEILITSDWLGDYFDTLLDLVIFICYFFIFIIHIILVKSILTTENLFYIMPMLGRMNLKTIEVFK